MASTCKPSGGTPASVGLWCKPFAGSLEGHRARKGVLITTSDFTADARDYVTRIKKRIVLISGTELADLMVEHRVGVTDVTTYVLKRLDSDYFEEED